MQDMATEIHGQSPDDHITEYDFKVLAEKIGEALLKAAEDQVVEADNLLERTKVLVEGIKAQVDEQAKLVTDMHVRLHTFGRSIMEAHSKYINGSK